jgi:alkylation response protein AidB-like acyl-CoA dehydrogenase
MDFQITADARELQERARRLAAEFATRAATHDREASSPMENYAALRREGFYELNVPKDRGGGGVGLLPWSMAVEELAGGCPATALAFNMHLSIVGPLMEIAAVPEATKSHIADLVVKQRKLIAGNFSEPQTSGLAASHGIPATRARHVEGGYRVNGKKSFASMIEAADYCALLARPEESEAPTAGILVLIPSDAPGRRIEHVWDTLGMRATRSENVLLEDCWITEEGGLYSTDDFPSFIRDGANWLWASYTAVYLGVGAAAYKEVVRVLKGRIPPLPSRRAPAGGGDERRPRSGASDGLQLGVDERYAGADGGRACRDVPREVLRGRGGIAHHAHGVDPGRRTRDLQDLSTGAAFS